MADALRPARSLLLTAAFLAATFTSTPVFAQAIDATKIGAINLSYVARMSKAGKEGLARIDDASRKKAAEVDARAAELQKQQAELQKGSGLSPRALADLQRAFEKSRIDFDRLQQDAQKEIEAMQAQFEMNFRAQLAPVIDEVSKEKGLQFVFGLEQAAIVWWSPAADISEDVVKRLDARK
jgi:Skp family chaperone for outer membrane proteins